MEEWGTQQGTDLTNLLYKFLEEFLYLLDAKQFLFSKIEKIKINKEKFIKRANKFTKLFN